MRKTAFVTALCASLITGSCTVRETLHSNGDDPTALTYEAKGCQDAFMDLEAGTFVMLQASTGQILVCDSERASARFVPASTFKVPHALIALELGIAEGPNDIIAWDGVQRTVSAWNQDATLETALQKSTIWYYQHIARRIGHKRMVKRVKTLEFGNADIGPLDNLTHFWLDGALRISAFEQIEFLDQLRQQTLPASEEAQATVRDMMKIRDLTHGALYAKSGLVLPIDPQNGDITDDPGVQARVERIERVGWYVGWVSRYEEFGGDIVFALNIRIRDNSDARRRAPLTEQLLQANGVQMQ